MNKNKVKTQIKVTGPLALYISYFILLLLSLGLIGFSFVLNVDSAVFTKVLLAGVFLALFSISLIFYSTHLVKKIDLAQWKKDASTYYEDEGIFDYTYNGFTILGKNSNVIELKWQDIVKLDSREKNLNDHIKVALIDIYFSDKEFITVDSTMAGFVLFEKRLKENMKYLWKSDAISDKRERELKKSISNLR